jgi:hypothetical protein
LSQPSVESDVFLLSSKFSQSPQGKSNDPFTYMGSRFVDSAFVATLYTSDSDKMMRYTDEGETNELCKWTVDLSSLPTFRQNASMPHMGGFYTGV